ncbi:hypothetical protein [Corynebacterium appendicis]|uniref:hypothetical protein n=1 Tax=Corynebacterium appendicis TaxID=163202 RepID=UPI00254EC407|nr:hypothetical protein [Corynebacterium appendicis]MDK8625163.1 hypothetical protein [Corynebacterium appendicis]
MADFIGRTGRDVPGNVVVPEGSGEGVAGVVRGPCFGCALNVCGGDAVIHFVEICEDYRIRAMLGFPDDNRPGPHGADDKAASKNCACHFWADGHSFLPNASSQTVLGFQP